MSGHLKIKTESLDEWIDRVGLRTFVLEAEVPLGLHGVSEYDMASTIRMLMITLRQDMELSKEIKEIGDSDVLVVKPETKAMIEQIAAIGKCTPEDIVERLVDAVYER